MFVLTHYHGFNAAIRQVESSKTDSAVNATDLTAYTFSAKAFGAAHSNRKIEIHIAATSATAGRTISTVTIGGVSAAVTSDGVTSAVADGGSGSNLSAFWIAAVPTGATGDIVVTFSAGMDNCGITVYRLINAATTAHHVMTDVSVTANALSGSLNVIGFGAVIGGVKWESNTDRTNTWSGLSLTEDVDAVIETGDATYSSASNTFNTTAASQTVTATASDTVDAGALVAVSHKPL